MQPFAPFAALLLIAAPLAAAAPGLAHADGIERPHHVIHRRPHRCPPPPAPVPLVPQKVAEGLETVTLSQAFFAGSSGGVGADIESGYIGGGTIMVSSSGARSVAVAFASASAHAGIGVHAGGHFSGYGGGCGCH